MKSLSFIIVYIFIAVNVLNSQLLINELDCDSPGVDNKEFIELRSETPYFSMDGYILVFFNGSSSGGNTSYFALDLNGYSTDINGLFLIGSKSVSPFPQLLISENVIQNGADGIGIYQADINDFPEGTLAGSANIIDALVYDTSDADIQSMMDLLGVNIQINENQNSKKNTESIQRNDDGSYFVGAPTPRQMNDGSGVLLNGISISTTKEQYGEGEMIEVVFTCQQIVEEDLLINFSLINNTFNEVDYSGDVSVIIPMGMNSQSTSIAIVDDTMDEGDEVLIIRMGEIPELFIAMNDQVELRIVDNDFIIADWGIPVDPTIGVISGTQDADYYRSLNGLSGQALRDALQSIVADPVEVRAHSYTDIVDILMEADQNPANSNQVWLVYTEEGRAKLDFQYSSNSTGKWNREHTFPRSLGGYHSIEADDIADGKNVYWETNADSLRHANSDAHGIRAADGPENSNRGNKHYGEYNGPQGNLGSFKGDVARGVLYLDIRYNGLEVVNGYPSVNGQMGDLATLLEWHREDPPDDFEMNRNNVIYEWQRNRNPFIDRPDMVEYIWGEEMGEIWTEQVSTANFAEAKIIVFPNPAKDRIFIEGLEAPAKLLLYSNFNIINKMETDLSEIEMELDGTPGIYYLLILTGKGRSLKKIMME